MENKGDESVSPRVFIFYTSCVRRKKRIANANCENSQQLGNI